MRNLNSFYGCLLGGAVGDALGYTVEFWSEEQIHSHYGEQGITEYSLVDGVAQISDDTQMTLYTANGLLYGTTRGRLRGIMDSYEEYIGRMYREWFKTQTQVFPVKPEESLSWLNRVPELYHRRAPGNTCLSALQSPALGSVEKPINNSKGCGGVMRVAPIGLYFCGKPGSYETSDMLGAEAAALTHGHELGYIPAAMLAHIIRAVVENPETSLLDVVLGAKSAIGNMFKNAKHLPVLMDLIDRAVELSRSEQPDLNAIHELGEGWVAEETLAIAIYCALKYENDFEKAIIAAVNHRGDSDSTGAVTGNILGAYLGLGQIPQKFLDQLELKNIITEVAEDLYHDCRMDEYDSAEDSTWIKKYV